MMALIVCPSPAVANLGVSAELQAKLQDVMIVRSLLSIGKILGEGGCAALCFVVRWCFLRGAIKVTFLTCHISHSV